MFCLRKVKQTFLDKSFKNDVPKKKKKKKTNVFASGSNVAQPFDCSKK